MLRLFKAFFMMLRAHINQKDKAGRCYIFHPINVAVGVTGVRAKTVALLQCNLCTMETAILLLSMDLKHLTSRIFDDSHWQEEDDE